MAVTTRSNGRSPTSPKPTMLKTPLPQRASPARQPDSKPSPYLLLTYAVILAAGSLYSQISPAAVPAHSAPLAPGLSSDLNTPYRPSPTNYFAGKHNLINIYFVKNGWFWTTLAFAILQFTTHPSKSTSKQPHYVRVTVRYALVTLAWFLTAKWFFGPALIDRSFTITGGHCEAPPVKLRDSLEPVDLSAITSSVACKATGGRWRGGHDISGHVFMLVLSSAFLLLELYLADQQSPHPHVSPRAAAALAHDMTEEERRGVGGWETEQAAKIRIWSRYFLWGVVALDLWMLMMTAIWFHTWLEKLSGLMIAAATLWSIYWMPEFVPAWKQIVGGL